jgi:CheY-like chemotaxis protein
MEETIKQKPNGKKKILLAEDDKINQLLFSHLLRDVADELVMVDDGAEAIRQFEQDRDFNLVLMDIKMPVIDGYEATRRILDLDPAAKVVALTAYAFEFEKDQALLQGFVDYVSKPVRRETLIETIFRHLDD